MNAPGRIPAQATRAQWIVSKLPVESDCWTLFVYGTLRKGFRLHHHLARLSASFLENGKVTGELFDLGTYPGARPVEDQNRWLYGELYALTNPASDLEVLDEIEDFKPSAPDQGEFIRDITDVVVSSGSIKQAWIYWLANPPSENCVRIDSGNYAGSSPALYTMSTADESH